MHAGTVEVPTTTPPGAERSEVDASVTFPLLLACAALIFLTYRRGLAVRRMLSGERVPKSSSTK